MVRAVSLRVVVDTNVLVRGLINMASTSGIVLHACETGNILVLLSKPVLREYRVILTDPELVARYPQLESLRVRTALEHLAYVGEKVNLGRIQFDFPRDPKDSKFLELCIGGEATHLVTTDRDMLGLAEGRDDTAKRFRKRLPNIEIVEPKEFIERYAHEVGSVE